MNDRRPVVVLERIEPGQLPIYCTHGRATCVACAEWVWLGSETYDVVSLRLVDPICRQCAGRLLSPNSPRLGHIHDHRRADGPHE